MEWRTGDHGQCGDKMGEVPEALVEKVGAQSVRYQETVVDRAIEVVGTQGHERAPGESPSQACESSSGHAITSSRVQRHLAEDVVWRSTSARVVSGDISAMLWNGVMRMPRFSAAEVQELLELAVVGGAGARCRCGAARAEAVLRAAPSWVTMPRARSVPRAGRGRLRRSAGQGDHAGEGLVGEHLLEGRATRPGRARCRRACRRRRPRTSSRRRRSKMRRGTSRDPEGADRHAAADGLADGHQSGRGRRLACSRRGRR